MAILLLYGELSFRAVGYMCIAPVLWFYAFRNPPHRFKRRQKSGYRNFSFRLCFLCFFFATWGLCGY